MIEGLQTALNQTACLLNIGNVMANGHWNIYCFHLNFGILGRLKAPAFERSQMGSYY